MGRLKTPRHRPAPGPRGESDTGDWTLVLCRDPAEIDAARWNALVERQPSGSPFVSIEYLRALHIAVTSHFAGRRSDGFLVVWMKAVHGRVLRKSLSRGLSLALLSAYLLTLGMTAAGFVVAFSASAHRTPTRIQAQPAR